MINITNVRAKRLYVAEFDRHMTVLENTFIREIRPLLGRQFFNSASLVQQGVGIEGVSHAVDLGRRRLIDIFQRHYKRVAASFSRKAYKIFEESQKKEAYYQGGEWVELLPSEMKTPKDEFWLSMNKWSRRQGAQKIRGIQDTTKNTIAKIIRRGQSDGESHREIAKRIRKTSAAINPHRSRTIALTETHTAAVKSVDVAVASTRIEMEREWVSAKDDRTRTRGRHNPWEHFKSFKNGGADGEKVAQDGLFKGTGQALRFPGDPRGSAGNVIRCLTSYKTAIYTSKGWKRIKDIVIGDLVLTHKNRFKKVLRTNTDLYEDEIVTIKIEDQGWAITVTPEHPFLIRSKKSKFTRWENAEDIVPGDEVSFMAAYCRYCGKAVPYYLKSCNRNCGSKVTAIEQWKDPEHRKNISKKAAAQMKREFANGTRDRFEIIKKARQVHFDKWGPGGSLKVLSKTPEFQRKRLLAIEKKYGSVLDMLKKFAFPALGKVNFGGSKIEQAMAAFLNKGNKDFVAQFSVGRRRIDFYIEAEKLFIEVDGYPFHEDKEGERKRDLEILTQYPDHQIAHVDYKPNPPKWEFFDLVALNHTGTFSQIGMKVQSVSKRQLKENIKIYNLAVEDDESYIAKGFVTHNCRCVIIYHSVKRTQELKPYEPEVLPGVQPELTWDRKLDYEQSVKQFKDKIGGFDFVADLEILDAERRGVINILGSDFVEIQKNRKGLRNLLSANKTKSGKFQAANLKKLNDKKGITGRYFTDNLSISIATKQKKIPQLTIGKETFNVGKDIRSLARHEMGHHIHSIIPQGFKNKEWIDIYAELKIKKIKTIEKIISKYASANSKELFAESFSAYTSPLYKKGMLPKEIEKYFGKIFN